MVSQMDALSSFAYLADNIPEWLTQVNDLSTYTTKRHAEFAAEYTRIVNHMRPKKQKSPSMISQRSNDKGSEKDQGSIRSKTSAASRSNLELNPLEAGNRYLFASARRPQKNTGHSVRSGLSGPIKFRQKHAVVVYYDSHVQTGLESMVKNIGTARNNLRKGKKARALARGPMLPTFPSPSFRITAHLDDDEKHKQTMQRANIIPKIYDRQPATEDECFELADKDLESAQSLCETAAHQFLRDGTSSVELEKAKGKLERVLELAQLTVKRLKEEEERIRTELEESETPVDEGDEDGNYFRFGKSTPELKVHLPTSLLKPATPVDRDVTTIEVDEDAGGDDLDGALDISRYQSMLRTTIRT